MKRPQRREHHADRAHQHAHQHLREDRERRRQVDGAALDERHQHVALEHLHREIGEQFRPPAILRQMVRAGRLGKKSGEGFYKWTADGPVPFHYPAPEYGADLELAT